MVAIDQHNTEIGVNLISWQKKPILRRIYRSLHERIAAQVVRQEGGRIVELGSGIGNIKEVIPDCLRTDLFANPWIDQVEDAYRLSFADHSVSTLILFDVFHHLRYPGTALDEFARVLMPGGRVIVFDPCISLLGALVYGLFHHEPVGLFRPITWRAPSGWSPDKEPYYAQQGNATRIFLGSAYRSHLAGWRVVSCSRLSCFSYVTSGGYSKPQLYPSTAYGLMTRLDSLLDYLPTLCATRLLVVLEVGD